MRRMSQDDYIERYCGNDYRNWLQKSHHMCMLHEQDAFHDIWIWLDFEHDIEVFYSYYIGD